MDNIIRIKDANGTYRRINCDDLIKFLSDNKFSVFGIGIDEIAELKNWYFALGGQLPITSESIRDIFSTSFKESK